MKLEIVLSKCDNEKGCAGGKCPTVYKTDDGRIIVQGYKLDSELSGNISLSPNETAVVLSKDFMDECVKEYIKGLA